MNMDEGKMVEALRIGNEDDFARMAPPEDVLERRGLLREILDAIRSLAPNRKEEKKKKATEASEADAAGEKDGGVAEESAELADEDSRRDVPILPQLHLPGNRRYTPEADEDDCSEEDTAEDATDSAEDATDSAEDATDTTEDATDSAEDATDAAEDGGSEKKEAHEPESAVAPQLPESDEAGNDDGKKEQGNKDESGEAGKVRIEGIEEGERQRVAGIVERLGREIASGAVSEEMGKLLLRGADYARAVTEARENGHREGRNARIDELMQEEYGNDGVPHLVSGGGPEYAARADSIFALAEGAR